MSPHCLLAVACLLAGSLLAGQQDTAKQKAKKPKPKQDVEAIGERDVDGGVNFYSLEKEIALGKRLAEDVERSAKIIGDSIVAEYVNRLGQNLVRNSDAKVPFTFKVIEDDVVNAFALPGGFLFVNTGLIDKAETEAELAGVLAHEIAHVAARHGTRQATRGQITNLASIPLILAGGGGWAGYAIYQAAGLAIPLTFLEFSREFEREADFLGLQYLYKAGYDPAAFIDFFERLLAMEKRKPGTFAKVFRSHPLTADRITAAQDEIERILPPKPEYAVSTSEFQVVKERLEQLHQRVKRTEGTTGPTLKKRPSEGGKIDPQDDEDVTGGEEAEEEPPKLKRRPE